MKNIIVYFYDKEHATFHQLSNALNENGGYIAIKQLTSHNSESISVMAYELSKYENSNECPKCKHTEVIPTTITMNPNRGQYFAFGM